MKEPLEKWLTCAPRDFEGDEGFFARDTGLFSRGLIQCGRESRAVLIGNSRRDDCGDLIRASLSDLVDPEWWRGHGVDAVVLQTWSDRALTPVATAIRAAGARLVLIQDSAGVVGPLVGWWDWIVESWYFSRKVGRLAFAHFLVKMLHGHTLRLFRFEKERARQFALADVIAVPSSPAVERYRKLAFRYGGREGLEKVHLIPHPIAPWFEWKGVVKENRIAAIGRWDDFHQKRPDILGGSLERFLAENPGWQADLFGNPGDWLSRWHERLPSEVRSRVIFHGKVASRMLASHLQKAKILFCPSAYESFHIASGEGLCSGASVVGVDGPMTASHRWFSSESSGTLSPKLDAALLAEALATEVAAWDRGERDPAMISAVWCSRLHAEKAAGAILRALGGEPSPVPVAE